MNKQKKLIPSTPNIDEVNRIIDVVLSFYGIDDITAKINFFPYPEARGVAALILADENYPVSLIAKRFNQHRQTTYDRLKSIRNELELCPKSQMSINYNLIIQEL